MTERQKYPNDPDHSMSGTRWCGSCRFSRPVKDGVWHETDYGKSRKWKCAGCVEVTNRRMKKTDEEKSG